MHTEIQQQIERQTKIKTDDKENQSPYICVSMHACMLHQNKLLKSLHTQRIDLKRS